jgi:prephenate dehydrogenase (NADP+)
MSKSASLVYLHCVVMCILMSGLGDMGRMYARLISKAGWKSKPTLETRTNGRVNACDRPDRYERIRKEFEGNLPTPRCKLISGSSINIVENGHLVSRRSDFILYSVEAEYVDEVVKTYGPCNSLYE